MTFTAFYPIITVYDAGKIEIHWADSMGSTFNEDGTAIDRQDAHSDLLDRVLGPTAEFSEADRLRRLADHLDGKSPT